MATKKSTRKSTSRATQQEGAAAWADFYKFVAEQGPAVIKEYGLEEGDLDGGLAIAAWIASLCRDEESRALAQVDAAIRYLDPLPSA